MVIILTHSRVCLPPRHATQPDGPPIVHDGEQKCDDDDGALDCAVSSDSDLPAIESDQEEGEEVPFGSVPPTPSSSSSAEARDTFQQAGDVILAAQERSVDHGSVTLPVS